MDRIPLRVFGKIKSGFKLLAEGMVLRVFLAITVFMTIGATVVYFFERDQNSEHFESIYQAVWWALVTMTTVGYGDKVPMTVGGRLAGAVIMFSGVALVSVFTATISSIYVARKIREGKGLEKINFENHIVICGWYQHAETLLESLLSLRNNQQLNIALINELPEDEINNVLYKHEELNIKFVRGDFTSESVLDLANVREADTVLIVPDTSTVSTSEPDERTILTTLTLKSMNPNVKVYAHIINPASKAHLRRANVDDIVVQDEFTGFLLASHVANPGIPQTFSELLNYSIRMNLQRADIPSNMVGKSFSELSEYIRESKEGILIGITSEREPVKISDVLTADASSLDHFIERKFAESGINLESEKGHRVEINPPDDLVINSSDVALVISEKRD